MSLLRHSARVVRDGKKSKTPLLLLLRLLLLRLANNKSAAVAAVSCVCYIMQRIEVRASFDSQALLVSLESTMHIAQCQRSSQQEKRHEALRRFCENIIAVCIL